MLAVAASNTHWCDSRHSRGHQMIFVSFSLLEFAVSSLYKLIHSPSPSTYLQYTRVQPDINLHASKLASKFASRGERIQTDSRYLKCPEDAFFSVGTKPQCTGFRNFLYIKSYQRIDGLLRRDSSLLELSNMEKPKRCLKNRRRSELLYQWWMMGSGLNFFLPSQAKASSHWKKKCIIQRHD